MRRFVVALVYRDGGTEFIPRWPQDHAAVDEYRYPGLLTVTDLSALFAEQQATQIEWHGPLYELYDLPSSSRSFQLRFLSSTSAFRQGVRLKVRGGALTIGESTASEFVLWADNAPDCVQVKAQWKSRGARSLRIWNCWEYNGIAHAWLGNAGMRVDDGAVRLRCSDGDGEPDFDDLVVEVRVL